MGLLLLGLHNNADDVKKIREQSKNRLIISEIPFPGAICVPHYLSTILPLDKPIEEVIANISKDKLRLYRKNRQYFHTREILNNEEIEHLDKTMFRPYATDRYGEGAAHQEISIIKKMATELGALHLVYFNNEEISCYIGTEFSYRGQRYWRSLRSGYPKEVFLDSKKFGVTNAMNLYLEIEWVIENKYDFYDIGVSLACPDDGVIQWKRSQRGYLSKMSNHSYFYVCPPKKNTSFFYWETPLFGLENGNLTLHLGLPNMKTDEEFITRIRQMGFAGLTLIYLHCDQKPSDNIISSIKSLYTHLEYPPKIKLSYH